MFPLVGSLLDNAKLTKKKHSPREDGFHFSSDKFMNFFDDKIMIIRKQITDSSLNLRISPKLSCPVSRMFNIINGSLSTGCVPNSLKVAVIKPLLKKPKLTQNI